MASLEVFEQFKAEVDGAELTAAKKLALQQKYGLVDLTGEEIDWYLEVLAGEVSNG